MTSFLKLNPATGRILLAGSLALAFSTAADEMSNDALAPTTHESVDSSVVQTESIGRSTNVESKLSSEFAEFLGGEERAAEVVSGLRTGEAFEITEIQDEKLVTTPTGQMGDQPSSGSTETGVTIEPPTDNMGYGNVRLTLRLAQANLETLGITHPTNEQLSAMLVGGEIDGVQFEGILNQRAAGAGWGEIAQRYDIKVGQLMGNAPSGKVNAPMGGRPKARTAQGNPYIARGVTKSGYIPSGGHRSANNIKPVGNRANGYIPSGTPTRGASAAYATTSDAVAESHLPKKNGYIASGKHYATRSSITSAHPASSSHIAKSGNGHAKGLSKGYVPSTPSAGAGVVSASNLAAATTIGAGNGRGHAKQLGKSK